MASSEPEFDLRVSVSFVRGRVSVFLRFGLGFKSLGFGVWSLMFHSFRNGTLDVFEIMPEKRALDAVVRFIGEMRVAGQAA